MKDKIDLQLSKYIMYGIYVVAILGVFSFFRGCSTAKENTRLRKELTELTVEVDSLNTNHVNALKTSTRKMK